MKKIIAAAMLVASASAASAATREDCIKAGASMLETIIANHAKITEQSYAKSYRDFMDDPDRAGRTVEARIDLVENMRILGFVNATEKVCTEAGLATELEAGSLGRAFIDTTPKK